MIDFKNVSFSYNEEAKILDDVSFFIEPGTFTALLGPSGAGKSTILWHIMGEYTPNAGTVSCMSINPARLKKKRLMLYRRKIGFVPQELLLLENHNVYSNVEIVLRGIGLPKKEVKARTENVLEIVGLRNRKKAMPFELSGGERQRLAIARALGKMPQILLADEPTGNLDPERSREILELFRSIHDMGITVLVATHERDLMTELGADKLILEAGKTRLEKSTLCAPDTTSDNK